MWTHRHGCLSCTSERHQAWEGLATALWRGGVRLSWHGVFLLYQEKKLGLLALWSGVRGKGKESKPPIPRTRQVWVSIPAYHS